MKYTSTPTTTTDARNKSPPVLTRRRHWRRPSSSGTSDSVMIPNIATPQIPLSIMRPHTDRTREDSNHEQVIVEVPASRLRHSDEDEKSHYRCIRRRTRRCPEGGSLDQAMIGRPKRRRRTNVNEYLHRLIFVAILSAVQIAASAIDIDTAKVNGSSLATNSDINNNNNAISVPKAEALTAPANSPRHSKSAADSSNAVVASCKSQSRTHLELTNLSQVVFEPSDICSSWQKMVRSEIMTAPADYSSSSTSNLHRPWIQIERLDLSHNNLTVLHDSSGLSRLINLIELRITHNQLARCEESALANLRNLQILDLSHNRLPALPSKFFQPVRVTLKKLNMSFNSISVLVPTLFDSLNQLESLDLSHNDITSHWINDRLFKNLTQLHYLDLSFNKLTVLSSPTTFSSLQQLETLSLQHNELRQVPETIQYLRYLSSLDLSQNLIHEISNASYLSNCRLLFNLNLESNLLENITRDAFVDLPALKVLNLANNRIHYLDQQAFDYVPDLHALRLDSNRLTDFGQAFVNLRFLLMLNISSNRISSFDYAQIPLGLQWLDLHANKIDRLNNFYYTPTAQQQYTAAGLAAAGNNMNNNLDNPASPAATSAAAAAATHSIGQQWQSMLRLTTLDASHNLIRDLDNTSLPESLETVQLNNNQIKQIASHTFASKSNLTKINLSHNQLSTLVFDALRLNSNNHNYLQQQQQQSPQQQLPKLVDVQLAGNPIICNCNTGWLTQLLLASSTLMSPPNTHSHQQQQQQLNEHQLAILNRQVPRIIDAHLVQCELPFARQTPFTADPYKWSPIGAANQLATSLVLHNSRQLSTTNGNTGSAGNGQNSNNNNNNNHLQLQPSQIVERQSELLASVHLCPYKSHCFALCYCCDFDACDCEMSCPENCSCYYDQTWSTNIVDCSATNQINSNTNAVMQSGVRPTLHQQQPRHLVTFANIPEKIPMDVTMLYLDGLALMQVRANALIGRRNLKSLYLNNSQIYSIEPKALATQKSLRVLQLNSNYLTELIGHEFEQQTDLRELYLAQNRLRKIGNQTFSSLRSLQVLHLQNNQLHAINFWSNFPALISPSQATTRQSTSGQLISLNLGSNPWSCQCDQVESMLRWLQMNMKHLHDRKSIQCQYNRTTSLHLLPLEYASSPTALVPSNSFDMTMCLNHTVLYGGQPAPMDNQPMLPVDPSNPFLIGGQQVPTTTSASTFGQEQPLDEPMFANGSSGFPTANDEPSTGLARPSAANYPQVGNAHLPPGYWADPIAAPAPAQPPQAPPPAYQYPPRQSASNPAGAGAMLVLGALVSLILLLIVLVSLVHRRRSMHAWLRSSSLGHAFVSSGKSGAAAGAVKGAGAGHGLKHAAQYGVSSGASTSSSSGASSSLSQALCGRHNSSNIVRAGTGTAMDINNHHRTATSQSAISQATPLIVRSSSNNNNTNTAHLSSQQQQQIAYSGEDEKLFDAYVTYSKHDEQFVNDFLAPELECGQPSYRVALHYRDLPVTTNEFLADCIIETANASRRVIMVVSEHMLASEWMQYEFRAAHLEALRNTYRQRLVIILLGPTLSSAQLDSDLYQWLKVCPCVHWGDKMFWQRLRFALPEIVCSTINRQPAAQYLRYQTIAPHQYEASKHQNSSTSSFVRTGGQLGANLLKSAGGLLGSVALNALGAGGGGGGHGNNNPPSGGAHQLAPTSGGMRPLPVPQRAPDMGDARHNHLSQLSQLNQQQQHHQHHQHHLNHHYAHLSPETMVSGTGAASANQRIYQQPIYEAAPVSTGHSNGSNDAASATSGGSAVAPVHI